MGRCKLGICLHLLSFNLCGPTTKQKKCNDCDGADSATAAGHVMVRQSVTGGIEAVCEGWWEWASGGKRGS